MAEWPELDEVKQVLNVDSDAWDGDADGTRFTRLLASAISHTKSLVCGTEVAYDEMYAEPTPSHAQAALRVAELLAVRPTETTALRFQVTIRQDATINRLLYGQRRRWGIA